MKITIRGFLIALLAGCGLFGAASARAQAADVVTVGTVSSASLNVVVPVYIRDLSGTSLGLDQPAGSRIQSFSIKVDYAPTAPVQSVTFTRAGITQPLTPTFESSPAVPGSITLLATFDEGTNLIPFTLNGAAPGNLIGHLNFTLAPGTLPGTVIALTLDTTLTQLTDEGGSGATKETVAAGNLAVVDGSITTLAAASPGVPALGTWGLLALAAGLALLAVRKLL